MDTLFYAAASHGHVVDHTVTGFSIVNGAGVHVFLKFSCLKFFYDPTDVGNFISGSSAFLNSA